MQPPGASRFVPVQNAPFLPLRSAIVGFARPNQGTAGTEDILLTHRKRGGRRYRIKRFRAGYADVRFKKIRHTILPFGFKVDYMYRFKSVSKYSCRPLSTFHPRYAHGPRDPAWLRRLRWIAAGLEALVTLFDKFVKHFVVIKRGNAKALGTVHAGSPRNRSSGVNNHALHRRQFSRRGDAALLPFQHAERCFKILVGVIRIPTQSRSLIGVMLPSGC